MTKAALVAGADGCRDAWVVAIAEATTPLSLRSLTTVASFKDILNVTRDCMAVGVDIPIGLCESEPRAPDREARKLLGGRRGSSVFPAPVRAALYCRDYREACDASQRACGRRISRQLFAILSKIREADEAMTPALQRRVVEVHPEVSFWAMHGGATVPASKHTPEGLRQRAALLSATFGRDAWELPIPRPAVRDDVFDACAVAWTASCLLAGGARRLPAEPLLDGRGLRMEIVY